MSAGRHQVGPYRLENLIGRGGMGEVYRAFDQKHQRWVALKHLIATPDAAGRARFRSEARILMRLRHPAMVRVYDFLEEEEGDWLVLELLEGYDLSRLVQDEPLAPELLISFARQLAAGLAAAHVQGLIHRDLKTENVMVLTGAPPGAEIRILDFGLAREITGAAPDSVDGSLLGTPRAMSPEQARGEACDARGDLFSLGVLLYELATTTSPFKAASVAATLRRVIHHRQPPAGSLAPHLPAPLSDLIDRLLRKNAADRPRSAAEVVELLDGIAAAKQPEAPAAEPAPPAAGPGNPRRYPAPELPAQPYPVLLPIAHPELLAGRGRELARLLRLLRLPQPLVGLFAPSGTGKSSLLAGAMVPALRAEGRPVAITRHPQEARLARRLLEDLFDRVEGPSGATEAPETESALLLAGLERLPATPVLVLDQFEEVLRSPQSRAQAGILLAVTATHRARGEGPLCHWVLAVRKEAQGETMIFLRDVLREAREAGWPVSGLPYDLSGQERLQIMALPPLATVRSGEDALAAAAGVFTDAIEKPLALLREDGRKVYPWSFAAGHAERLALAFARTRLARPEAPLAPELQVVLAHLLSRAGEQGELEVPADPEALIATALEDHLRRAFDRAFSAGDGAGRARALLALRELATAEGQRDGGLPPEGLIQAIGGDGERILARLSSPLTRLIVAVEKPDGLRYVLSHDRLAEVVTRMVEEEGRRGGLLTDSELIALRRVVALQSALHLAGEEAATRLPLRHFRKVAAHADALLWDDPRRAWWAACRRRRRADRGRRTAVAVLGGLLLLLMLLGVSEWQQRRAIRDQVARGEPEKALAALDRLRRAETPATEILARLRQRQVPSDVLECGLRGLGAADRDEGILRAVELFLPLVAERPEDPVLLANLVWALDYGPGRNSRLAAATRIRRDQVLAELRRRRPPPAWPVAGDPDWIAIPAGAYRMEKAGETREIFVPAFRLQRHELTRREIRQLWPGREGADALPATFTTWYDAMTFAAWRGGRLPSEVEWEYAAKAGCSHDFCDSRGKPTQRSAIAWTQRNAKDPVSGLPVVQPVMRLEPNPWGLYDTLGNVWEWTLSWSAPGPAVEIWGPPGPALHCEGRMLKGGGIWNSGQNVFITLGGADLPLLSNDASGFRVLLPAP